MQRKQIFCLFYTVYRKNKFSHDVNIAEKNAFPKKKKKDKGQCIIKCNNI